MTLAGNEDDVSLGRAADCHSDRGGAVRFDDHVRPGTPGHAATPATASARSTPVSTSATIAASALATLNGPGSVIDASASTPPGPTTWKAEPSAPHRTSAARQSAPDRPVAE